MKRSSFKQLCLLLSTSLLITSAFANENPIWPMPSPFPVAPAGANPAVFPMPKLDWIARVKTNNEKAVQIAGGIQLIFDGDSITDGWQGVGKAVWADRFERLGAFNFGISGDRTEHVLWRLSQGQAKGIQPKLIALMIGTNNMGSTYTSGQVADGVKAIVDEYRKRCPGATILLQGIFPRGHKSTDPIRAKIKDTNKLLSDLADGDKVIYLDLGDKFLESDGTISTEIMADYLHPNAKGYKIWADAIQPVIDKLFPDRQ